MKKHAFTLIELLAVIAIIAVLAGLLIGGLNHASKKADIAKTQALIEQLQEALEQYKQCYGTYPFAQPAKNAELTVSSGKILFCGKKFYNPKTNKPFIELEPGEIKDAWDNALRYQCPGDKNKQKYDLFSMGADGNPNTDDDITNWERN